MYGVRLRNHGGFSWVVTEAQEQLPSLGYFALCPKSFSRSAGGLALAGPTQRKACGGHSCEVETYLLKSDPRLQIRVQRLLGEEGRSVS